MNLSNVISIQIGSKNIHIAEGAFQKGKLNFRESLSYELPAGCLDDGSVADEQMLADSISSSIRAGAFNSKEVILTMNANHAIIRELDFPPAKPKELDSMIKNEMYQTFHILKTDIIQYKEIGIVTNNEGETLTRYRVAAMDQAYVDAYYKVLERANLKPIAMDLNINAIEKLFAWTDSMNEKLIGEQAVMLLDFGYSSTTVYIFTKDQPLFYRHLTIGASEIDNLLTSTFYLEPSDVRKLKESLNFFDQSDESARYYEALKPYLYRMNDEIRKVITFFNNRARSANIESAYLFGHGSQLEGLEEYLKGGLNLPLEKIRSVSKADNAIKITNSAHLNAIAALIRNEY